MGEILSASVARARFAALVLGGFGVLALGLGAIGIYGVLSSLVAQRTRELGVRMALGATSQNVVVLVLVRGMALAGMGVAIGITLALATTRAFARLLYRVTATDTRTFVLAPLLLFSVALVAIWIPARRAVRIDPLVALWSD